MRPTKECVPNSLTQHIKPRQLKPSRRRGNRRGAAVELSDAAAGRTVNRNRGTARGMGSANEPPGLREKKGINNGVPPRRREQKVNYANKSTEPWTRSPLGHSFSPTRLPDLTLPVLFVEFWPGYKKTSANRTIALLIFFTIFLFMNFQVCVSRRKQHLVSPVVYQIPFLFLRPCYLSPRLTWEGGLYMCVWVYFHAILVGETWPGFQSLLPDGGSNLRGKGGEEGEKKENKLDSIMPRPDEKM